jgi:hypothetical protein
VTKDETVSTDAAFKALTFNKLYELAQSGFFFAIMDQFQLPQRLKRRILGPNSLPAFQAI